MIDIMSSLESVRLSLSPVPTYSHTHAKPPLSPVRSESSYVSNEAIEVFMPKSPTSMLDVRLMYWKDSKMQSVHFKARREVPSAIVFKPIHCENDEESREDDTCSTSSNDDASIYMEEEDDLLGLDLLADDDEEEDDEAAEREYDDYEDEMDTGSA
jgi:hypothetical protein